MKKVPHSLSTELSVLVRMCQEAKTPIAEKVLHSISQQNWKELVEYSVNPVDYSTAQTYFVDACIVNFIRKYPGFDLGYDLKKAAVHSFFESESRCFSTNQRFSQLLKDNESYGPGAHQLLAEVKREIASVLGKCPSPDALSQVRFGPGSTFANKGDLITVADKLTDDYTATSNFPLSMYCTWLETAWYRYAGQREIPHAFKDNPEDGPCRQEEDDWLAARHVSFVQGNRFTAVPKDATKHRGICIEPALNVYFQLGVGAVITDRLSRWGWSKKHTPTRHKHFARGGSMFGHVATIDLSSASDTIASNVVRAVLPPSWFELLDSLRSPKTFVDGKWVLLEKFSSMGNGYTFELETVLFWAISRAVCRLMGASNYEVCNLISVFGDDIIVPTTYAEATIKALSFFGLKTNESKTFIKGDFRESCGGDYFCGFDVRPFYLKKVCDEPHRIISLCNGLRRNNKRLSALGSSLRFDRSWHRAFNALPRPVARCKGPEELGDLVVHHDDWVYEADFKVRNSIRYIKVYKPKGNELLPWYYYAPSVVVACALYGAGDGGSSSLTERLDRFSDSKGRALLTRNPYGNRPVLAGSYISGYGFGRVAYS